MLISYLNKITNLIIYIKKIRKEVLKSWNSDEIWNQLNQQIKKKEKNNRQETFKKIDN